MDRIDALRSTPAGPDRRNAADLLPLLPEPTSLHPASETKPALRRGDAAALRPARRTPCVIILDDVQWFDEASAALLHFAIRAIAFGSFSRAARRVRLRDHPVAQHLLRSLSRGAPSSRSSCLPSGERIGSSCVRSPDVAAERVAKAGNPFALEITRALGGRADVEGLERLVSDRFQRVGPEGRTLLPERRLSAEVFARTCWAVAHDADADLVTGIEGSNDEASRRHISGRRDGHDFSDVSSVRPRTVRRRNRAALPALQIARSRA
jgi:hypothetical protein